MECQVFFILYNFASKKGSGNGGGVEGGSPPPALFLKEYSMFLLFSVCIT